MTSITNGVERRLKRKRLENKVKEGAEVKMMPISLAPISPASSECQRNRKTDLERASARLQTGLQLHLKIA